MKLTLLTAAVLVASLSGLTRALPMNGTKANSAQPINSTSLVNSIDSHMIPNPIAMCTAHRDTLLYTPFHIWGAHWSHDLLHGKDSQTHGGDWGHGLLHQLRRCTAVSQWVYERKATNSTQPYEFHATGLLGPLQRKCLQKAVIHAGAPLDVACPNPPYGFGLHSMYWYDHCIDRDNECNKHINDEGVSFGVGNGGSRPIPP